MGTKPINFPAMAALTGAEIIPGYQGGAEGRTTAQAIANLAAGATTEGIQDIIGALLAAGSGIDVTYNDAGNVETIALNTEAVQDIIGALLAAAAGVNGGIVVTYNDAGNAESIGLASSAFQTLTDAATVAWDMSAGYNAKVTLGGNRTLGTPTNPVEGRTYTLQVIQDGTGSRTLAYPAAVSFGSAGSPTLSTGAGKIDLIYLQCLDSSAPTFRATFNKSA